MSNLAQYRLSLAIFSLGLLWVVSEVVGDGEKPAPLDTATKSIVHRLKSADDESGDRAGSPYELAVSTTDSEAGEAPEIADAPTSPFASSPTPAEDAGELASPEPQSDEEAAQQPPGPDVGLIYK